MLTIFLGIFLYITFGFFLSVVIKRNDIADVMWGPGIFLAILISHFVFNSSNVLVLLLVFIWALRIFLHIGDRFINKKDEDFRYAQWRKAWKFFYLRSLCQVFILQGFLMFLVASSVIFLNSTGQVVNIYFYSFGLCLALFALIFETVADLQLKNFLQKKTGGILQTGLWRYSRHPNYFGEVLFWWGIFVSVLPTLNLTFLISPLTITFLILYVSGIPMLEKKYEGNKEFEIYKLKTSTFFPF